MRVLIVGGLTALREKTLLDKRVRVRFVTCGKANCACQIGKRHGPYYYIRRRVGNRYVDHYLKLANHDRPGLKYEAVNEDVVVDVRRLADLPADFRGYPKFLVRRRLREREQHEASS